MAEMYNLDILDPLLPDDPKCEQCGSVAVQRCSRCKTAWYCGRECQVKAWKVSHKATCDLIQAAVGIEQLST